MILKVKRETQEFILVRPNPGLRPVPDPKSDRDFHYNLLLPGEGETVTKPPFRTNRRNTTSLTKPRERERVQFQNQRRKQITHTT